MSKMEFKLLLILALCLSFQECSFQQYMTGKQQFNSNLPQRQEPTNWKAILIIVLSVLFVVAVIYGTNCFYICKMHFFERTEKKYTKMDSVVHV